MKYIVKNCPALCSGAEKWKLGFGENEHICKDGIRYCNNCTDCIIKRITELCNDVLEQETDPLNSSEMSFARKILDLLRIEEEQ